MVTMKDKNKQASMESGGPHYANLGPPYLRNISVQQTKYQEEERIIQQQITKRPTRQKTNNQSQCKPTWSFHPIDQPNNQSWH